MQRDIDDFLSRHNITLPEIFDSVIRAQVHNLLLYDIIINNNNPVYIYYLGLYYYLRKDFQKAEQKYLIAFENGNGNAANDLGLICAMRGKINLMIKYYKEAINLGCVNAMFNLACYHHKKKCLFDACYYYQMAAYHHHARSFVHLTQIYKNTDYIQAGKFALLSLIYGKMPLNFNDLKQVVIDIMNQPETFMISLLQESSQIINYNFQFTEESDLMLCLFQFYYHCLGEKENGINYLSRAVALRNKKSIFVLNKELDRLLFKRTSSSNKGFINKFNSYLTHGNEIIFNQSRCTNEHNIDHVKKVK